MWRDGLPTQPWPALAALSLCLNLWLLRSPRAEPHDRRLAADAAAEHCAAPPPRLDAMRDCASTACPREFAPSPAVETGDAVYWPFRADTRFRLHPPRSMLELTQLLYGESAVVGEPYRGYDNPFGRQPDMNYQWTQVNDAVLEQAWRLVGGRARLIVEVGSFVGKSSVVIGQWLQRREAAGAARGRRSARRRLGAVAGTNSSSADARRRLASSGTPRTRGGGGSPHGGGRPHGAVAAPPSAGGGPPPTLLLCIDSWLGDLGMLLG